MSEYRRSSYNREDPRLSRQNSLTSPKPNANLKSPNNGQPPENWNAQTGPYNHSQALQNAYQSLNYHNPAAHQYPTQTYYTGYQNYSYNPYENYQATQQAYMTSGAEPRPPGEEYAQGTWPTSNNYTTTSEPPPAQNYNSTPIPNDKKKNDGVAEEKIKQLAGLIKEREIYEERASSLSKKLKLLVEQKENLSAKRSPDKDTLRIIKENTKLQMEIQSKIKDATNVIEILSNLIGDQKKPAKTEDVKHEKKREEPAEVAAAAASDKVNFKHYDPEIHWCRMCDVFPQSAKELLLHLHSKAHQDAAQEEIPWHKLPPEPKFPTYEGAPAKRVPIKGLQFFVASTAWYCRLCDTWIGDLHCASQHLMSIAHSQNYTNFVEQNPHWEVEWMRDREKALDRVKRNKQSDSESDDGKRRRRRDKYSPSTLANKEKKKKKRSKRRKRHSSDDSSSSSSSSTSSDEEKEDKSKSIRVAMRNKPSEGDSKLETLEKIVQQSGKEDFRDDKLMSQWMSVTAPAEKEKQMFDNLREKLKQKHDAEKVKAAFEAEIARRQREREELERKENERIAQELLAKEEEEKKHREKMSLKLKEIKMKPELPNRRRSISRSPDRRRRRSRSRSPSMNRRSHTHRNGRSHERSPPPPRYDRDRRSRSRDRERNRKSRSRSRDRDHSKEDSDRDRKAQLHRKLPFIGRMPLFKNMKPKGKNEEEPPRREIQKEDYEPPRKTRFQPGNLARAFIPQPDVVCFPQLSSYPPIPPPPPPITPKVIPEAPKISKPPSPKPTPPPPPKLVPVEVQQPLDSKAERALKEAARELEQEEDDEEEKETAAEEVAAQQSADLSQNQQDDLTKSEDYMLYEDTSNNLYQYSSMDYNMMYPPAPPAYNFMQVNPSELESEPPKTHTMPLEPPPLPPDDPNEDLAMLGLSSDDMAVQQMY